jgi:hypothetical protein
MLIDQVRENGNIDLVLDESVNLFGHAELFEPVCNLLHRSDRRSHSGLTEAHSSS